MKKLAILGLFSVCLLLAGCKKEDYYVKYEAMIYDIKGSNYGMIVDVATDKGNETFNAKGSTFSQTFGPVKKGFNAQIKITTEATCSAQVNIYACRGEEPFVLKKYNSKNLYPSYSNRYLSTEYTIDF